MYELTREELQRVLELERRRIVTMRAALLRVREELEEMKRGRQRIVNELQVGHYGPEQEAILLALISKMECSLREFLGVATQKYGVSNIVLGYDRTGRQGGEYTDNELAAARVLQELYDFLGWDDE